MSRSLAEGRNSEFCSRQRSMRSRTGGARLSGIGGGSTDDAICRTENKTHTKNMLLQYRMACFFFPHSIVARRPVELFFCLPAVLQSLKDIRSLKAARVGDCTLITCHKPYRNTLKSVQSLEGVGRWGGGGT